MAENKKSFVLYADLIHTVSKLPDDVSGKLFKLILSYVNDENPSEPTDLVLQIAFEPIKLQLKRDLKRWESNIEQRRQAGLKSAESRQRNSTVVNDSQQTSTDNVNVTVNVNDNVTKRNTKVFTPPILSDVISYFVENGYTEQSAEKAFRYYNDAGWKDSKGNKVKNWKQKMQGVWFKDENKKQDKPKNSMPIPL